MSARPDSGRSARVRASERSAIAPFYVMRVLDQAAARRRAGLAVYELSAGQPATPAPRSVRDAAHKILDGGKIGYTSALGIAPLRAAIAAHYRHRYSADVDPESVAVTTGSSGAFLLAFLAAFEAGDTVVMARPGYPAYRNMLRALGCHVVELQCGPSTRFQPTVEMLDALERPPSGVIVASPANPTGTMLPADELAAIAAWCERHGVRFVSDEIYHGISYRAHADTAWRSSSSAIVVNSFSKYFSMTGWRIGWLLIPDGLRDRVERLAGNFTVCPPSLSQQAAIAAFDAYDELDANVARYAQNRAMLLDALPAIGIDKFAPPDGAFYVYADVSRWTEDSLTWAARLLDETGVAVAPGIDFDPIDGGRFIRLCFAGDGNEIARAIELLGGWLAGQRRPRTR